MKVTVLTENLQKKVVLLSHAISSKNQLPILQNILLVAKDGKIVLSATDLEIGMQTSTPANIDEEGKVAIPARSFIELVSSLPPGRITLSTKDNTFLVESDTVHSGFQITPEEEFPKLFEEKGEKIAEFPFKEIEEKLSRVIFATSQEAARPALTGVLLKRQTDGFLFVATDAIRLSMQSAPLETAAEEEDSFLVQSRVFKELLSLKDEEVVSLYASKKNNQILFEQNGTTIVGRLIDAQYPQYDKIIPTDHATRVHFDREAMLKAVRICAIFARETDDVIKLVLDKDKITVSANTPSVGENTVQIESTLIGEENAIAFNAKYLLDVLTRVGDNNLAFEMQGPLNPGVFKLQKDESFLHLIMPIRVQE